MIKTTNDFYAPKKRKMFSIVYACERTGAKNAKYTNAYQFMVDSNRERLIKENMDNISEEEIYSCICYRVHIKMQQLIFTNPKADQ